MKYGQGITNGLLRVASAMLVTGLYAGVAKAGDPPPVLQIGGTCGQSYTYAVTAGQTVTSSGDAKIFTENGGNNVNWNSVSGCTVGGDGTRRCINLAITVPSSPAADSTFVMATGTASSSGSETLSVTAQGLDAGGTPTTSCAGSFMFHVTSSGGGWGDPHLTTVDGIHYDFQSAGEFTALRGDEVEIQTRQSPVPTAKVPITNEYTGITHCVAIYTAVATKLGSTRITLQPKPGAEPDPRSMQLRVNGELTKLGSEPLVLRAKPEAGAKEGSIDATILQHADGLIEITDARGMQLVVTPQYWDSQKVWYLNVEVFQTAAQKGTMGSLAQRSWLPALPDGSSLGPKPASETDRYKALYEKFADAWRVTDATSLFDYEPGTSTATFTLDEWPRNHPDSCDIQGQTSVQPATEAVAEAACAKVANAVKRADCTFDVMITGNPGFAKGYEVMQGFGPRGSGWYTPEPPKRTPPKCPPGKTPPGPMPAPCPSPWCCWWLIVIGIVELLLLAFLVRQSLSKK